MLSTEQLIAAERSTLDALARRMTGADFAQHIAKQTRKYLLQEIVKYLQHRDSELAQAVKVHFEDMP